MNQLLYFLIFITCALATNHFAGIAASNSITGISSYTCRTQEQWNSLASNAKSNGFHSIRISGFDCNALDRASAAAMAANITILAGIYVPGAIASSIMSISQDVQTFRKAYAKYGSSRYAGLTIGNEVNDTPTNIMAQVHRVRDYLRAKEVLTPVSTVHTWIEIRDNPALCGADFAGANAHAFFDGQVTAEHAGNFLITSVVPSLKAACPGKRVVIAESGWPSRGASNSMASPSLSTERVALSSLNCAARNEPSVLVYAFEYDDQEWKANDNERSFGIYGKLALNGDC